MDKRELDSRITQMAKSILSYCIARTSSRFDAEDLAHDIIIEIYKSADNIRNMDAFYGFMWAVAGNVYKQWCKNKAKNKVCELNDNFPLKFLLPEDDTSEIFILRRELTLLAEKYRSAVILYYIENKSCSEISDLLSISKSMVKYLLFKSRQILKEGMVMERNYGQQSYNPKGLSLLFWGNGANRYYHLCDSKISQNILFACYNDKLTAEQISLEIGVALPYMEDKLRELYEYDIIKKEGKRYFTNIIIFTQDFINEVTTKTSNLKKQTAELIVETIEKHETEIRNIGFIGSDMNKNSFNWQIASFILYLSVIEILQYKINIAYPKDKFGTECFIWGKEKCKINDLHSQFEFGISNAVNKIGDYVQFMDFPINGEMIHNYCFNRQDIINVFLNIAKDNTIQFSENDLAIAADLVSRGYVLKNKNKLTVNAPVFTVAQRQKLKEILSAASEKIVQLKKYLKTIYPFTLKSMQKIWLILDCSRILYLLRLLI